jgi:hypothetical protein
MIFGEMCGKFTPHSLQAVSSSFDCPLFLAPSRVAAKLLLAHLYIGTKLRFQVHDVASAWGGVLKGAPHSERRSVACIDHLEVAR